MKRLTCEMCGGTDLIKQDGVFVCQNCGTKYSVEEAKKLMVEGTVQVEGTVKIDKTESLEKMMINAKRAYSDRKYAQAQNLYNQILNEDPDNATAIMYEGLSLGWQGTPTNYTMTKAGKAVTRAMDVAYDQMHDSADYEKFALDAVVEITELGWWIANIYKQFIETEIDKIKIKNEALVKEMEFDGSIGNLQRKEYYDEKFDKMAKVLMENSEKYQKIYDNTLLIMLLVYEKLIGKLSKVDLYKIDTYDVVEKALSKFKPGLAYYGVTYEKIEEIKEKFKKCKNNKKTFEIEKKKKKLEEEEGTAKIHNEIEQLKNKIKSELKRCDSVQSYENLIAFIENNKYAVYLSEDRDLCKLLLDSYKIRQKQKQEESARREINRRELEKNKCTIDRARSNCKIDQIIVVILLLIIIGLACLAVASHTIGWFWCALWPFIGVIAGVADIRSKKHTIENLEKKIQTIKNELGDTTYERTQTVEIPDNNEEQSDEPDAWKNRIIGIVIVVTIIAIVFIFTKL